MTMRSYLPMRDRIGGVMIKSIIVISAPMILDIGREVVGLHVEEVAIFEVCVSLKMDFQDYGLKEIRSFVSKTLFYLFLI